MNNLNKTLFGLVLSFFIKIIASVLIFVNIIFLPYLQNNCNIPVAFKMEWYNLNRVDKGPKIKISSLDYAPCGADDIEINFPTKCRKFKNNINIGYILIK